MEHHIDAKGICQSYEDAVTKLLNDLNLASSLTEIRKLFSDFHSMYTTVPSLWLKWIELEENTNYSDFNIEMLDIRRNDIKDKAQHHFCHTKFIQRECWMNAFKERHYFFDTNPLIEAAFHSRTKPTTTKVIEEALCFPHLGLYYVKAFCDKFGTKQYPNKILKQYENSKNLLRSIRKNGTQGRNCWYKGIVNMADKTYVIKSFEYRLAVRPGLKVVWKSYIKFLSTKVELLTLKVYSRYCRLFVDDIQMKEKYLKQIKKFNENSKNVSFWWIDFVELEKTFYSVESAKLSLDMAINMNKFSQDEEFLNYVQQFKEYEKNGCTLTNTFSSCLHYEAISTPPPSQMDFFISEKKNSCRVFSSENICIQYFSFPYNYMNYIFSTSKHGIQQKLYQSCKYFFMKTKIPLCYRFGIFEKCPTTYFEQSLFLNIKNINFDGLVGMKVTNMLQIMPSNTRNGVSLLLSKIQCEAVHIQIHYQILTKKELKIIAGDRVETILFSYVNVMDSDNRKLPLEDVINEFPKAFKIDIKSPFCTSETSKNLANLTRSHNLLHLYLKDVQETFNIEFFDFIRKFALRKACVCVKFEDAVDSDLKTAFYEAGKNCLASCHIDLQVL